MKRIVDYIEEAVRKGLKGKYAIYINSSDPDIGRITDVNMTLSGSEISVTYRKKGRVHSINIISSREFRVYRIFDRMEDAEKCARKIRAAAD